MSSYIPQPPGAGDQPPPPQTPRLGMVQVRLPEGRRIVTFIILGLTIIVFLLQVVTQSVMGYDYPLALGAKHNALISQGELWRLFTPMLLHGSLAHIGFNMYALLILGPGLERYYGHLRFLALYVVAGFAGNVFSFLFTPGISVGASTAIFGLVAAQGVFLYRHQQLFGARARSGLMNIIFIVAINLFLGLTPGIDNWGHLGGLFGGLALAWLGGPMLELVGATPYMELVNRRSEGETYLVALLVGLFFAGLAFWAIFFR
ncbi:MAG: rhomboid family intramembrane serine protease [Anaerolineaceae bacterium]